MSTEIDAIKKYLEWAEEQRLAGNDLPSIEQYEEALRVSDLEDRMTQIQDVLDGKDSPDGKIFLITQIMYPAVTR